MCACVYVCICMTGNNIALLDPLGINDADLDSGMPKELLAGDQMDPDQVRDHFETIGH